MIDIVNGDILCCEENIIVHQLNCMGKMGSGIAKQIANRWPTCYGLYSEQCGLYEDDPALLLGNVNWFNATEFYSSKTKLIAGVFGQVRYGHDGKQYTDYNALRIGLKRVAELAIKGGYSVAIPYGIGCGRGGGDWKNVVWPMIQEIFADVEKVVIYKLDEEKWRDKE